MEKRFHELSERLAELKQAFCNYKEEAEERFLHLRAKLDEQNARIDGLINELAALAAKYDQAVAHFNQAVETVNAMNERLTRLEANYDPTVI